MRELTQKEIEQVSGGIAWLIAVPILMLAGCATTQPLRRGEQPPENGG